MTNWLVSISGALILGVGLGAAQDDGLARRFTRELEELLLAAQAAGPQATPRVPPQLLPQAPPPQPTALIRGRVMTADTSRPIRGAEVRARDVEGNDDRFTTTDDEGRYEMRGITPGLWNLAASKGGFVTQQFGQRRPAEAPEVLVIAGKQRVTADFGLTRAGVIAGRIYDEVGDPVAGARVQVMRTRMVLGRRQATPAGVGDFTDDMGMFRLYGLAGGNYYLAASLRVAPAEDLAVKAFTGMPTFYPGTAVLADAQRIALGPGEELVAVNFPVLAARGVRVSGVVLDAAAAPAEGASVTLSSTTDVSVTGMPVGSTAQSGRGGTFTIVNVPPGSYQLTARLASKAGPTSGDVATLPITVGTESLTGILAVASRSPSVTFSVAADGKASGGLPDRLFLRVRSVDGSQSVNLSGTRLGVGTFFVFPESALAVGLWTIDVTGLPDTWMVKSVSVNGLDSSGRPAEIRPGVRGAVRVLLTDRVGSLGGGVTSRGEPAPDAIVVVFPDDETKWHYLSRYVRTARADGKGQFRVSPLPAFDRYLAVAVDSLDEGETDDPDVLQGLKDRATSVAIREAEAKSLSLTLVRR